LGGEYGEIKSFCGKYFSNMEGEDTTVASFKFTGGYLGLLIYSWSIKNPPKVPAFEIYGEKGSVYPWRNLSLLLIPPRAPLSRDHTQSPLSPWG
jgi:predicted dehydrogenase